MYELEVKVKQLSVRRLLASYWKPDPEGQVILEERYLRMVKWEQIATTLNMSMRKVFRLHDETLKKIVIPESWQ